MNRDLELATRCLVDVGDELIDVLGVEVGRRIGRRHVPLGLSACRHRYPDAKRYDQHLSSRHFPAPRKNARANAKSRPAPMSIRAGFRAQWAGRSGGDSSSRLSSVLKPK